MSHSHFPNDSAPESHDACTGCSADAAGYANTPDWPERRRFLRDSLAAVAAAMLTLGVSRTASAALAVGPLEALGRGARRDTRRYAIPTADGVQIDRDSQVILVRWQSAVYAFALSCPHQNTALRWVPGDARFQCPKHHSKYQPDGSFIEGRATRAMDRFSLQRDGDAVIVDLDALHRRDTDLAGWDAAAVKLSTPHA